MKFFIIAIFITNLFGGIYDNLAKNSLKFIKPNIIESIGKKYGDDGVVALERLSVKYQDKSLQKFNSIANEYGVNGIKVVAKYGDDVALNKNTIGMISKYEDKGFYMIKQYPSSSLYYEKFGDKFMINADKYGNQRVMKYLDDSSKFGQDGKVLDLLDKFGNKANMFFQENWGKLTTIGFVTLNSDEIINSIENFGKESIKTVGETTAKSVDSIANSNLGLLLSIEGVIFLIQFIKLIVVIDNSFKFSDLFNDGYSFAS